MIAFNETKELPVFFPLDKPIPLSDILQSYSEPQLYQVEGSSSMNDYFSLMLSENRCQDSKKMTIPKQEPSRIQRLINAVFLRE